MIRQKRTVRRIELNAENRRGLLQRAGEGWVAVRQIIQSAVTDVVQKDSGPNIAGAPVDAEHLGVKTAPEQAIVQVEFSKGSLTIEEKEFDIPGQLWIRSQGPGEFDEHSRIRSAVTCTGISKFLGGRGIEMCTNQKSLSRRRAPRKTRDEIAKLELMPVRRLFTESLIAGLPAETGQTINEVLANLPIRIATRWPGTEISQRLRFRQSLTTVKISPDILSAGRRPSRYGAARPVCLDLRFWRFSGCGNFARLAIGDDEKEAEKPDHAQCQPTAGLSLRRLKPSCRFCPLPTDYWQLILTTH